MPQFITTDGKTARLVNPYIMTEPFKGDASTVNPGEVLDRLKNLRDFERTVQHYPLTKELDPGTVFSGQVVWQVKGINQKEWQNTNELNATGWYSDKNHFETRQTIQPLDVPVKGEEKVSDFISVRNVVDIAAKAAVKGFDKRMLNENHGAYYLGFLDGWNEHEAHALSSANLVGLDEVVKLIEHHAKVAFQCAEEETDTLIKNIQHSVGLELTDLITQIKQLKPVKE